MAPLQQFNTERWWVVYTVNGNTHRMMCRTSDGGVPATMSLVFHGIFNRLAADLYTVAPQNLEFALRGSNVRNTAAWSQSASYGLGNADSNDDRAKAVSFVGRSFLGRRARLFVYGFKVDANGDYRTLSAENANVANVVTYLNGASGAFLAIDGAQPVYKGYANVGYNDHWVKQLRKGA